MFKNSEKKVMNFKNEHWDEKMVKPSCELMVDLKLGQQNVRASCESRMDLQLGQIKGSMAELHVNDGLLTGTEN